ncbi:hypothetical protein [Holdemanella biformis]|uniref:hypothetical protein n=1 Tax=Holdemanella biformis TaxID=1735 RepID=UPI0022E05C26|nr:hypothetical protein [Holdemanella biformis]
MSEQELKNLQIYIGKRNQNQTDEQVIDHIKKINDETPLTQEEWHKLIFPSCNNGQVEILKFVLSHIQSLNNVKEYMIHTVYGRNENINENRIVVLKEFIKYLTDNKEECLNETMINAGWFGKTEIVKFLIKNGANKGYKNQNDLGLLECSERVEKQFKDSSLKEFLKNNQ